ncbi:MAG: acyltransferase [Sphaerochaetaceae bacterium]
MASKFSFNSDLLSKHRSSLYGVAAIMIICVHSCKFWGNESALARLASSIFQYGSLGVPVFGFLGGVGLYFSLIKKPKLSTYYLKRFKRVFLPYLCIAFIWYAYEYLILKFDFMSFCMEISTVGFWTQHTSMWYIAMLIPVYALFPFYSRWIERGKRGIRTTVAIIIIFLLMVIIYHIDPSLHQHLQLVLRTLALILFGYYLGEKVIRKERLSILYVIAPIALFATYKLILRCFHLPEYEPFWSMNFAFLALPVSIVLSILFEYVGSMVAPLRSFGAVSLESYVWNQVLIKFQQAISAYNGFCASHPLMIYILLVPVGIFLSYLTYWLLQGKGARNNRKVL